MSTTRKRARKADDDFKVEEVKGEARHVAAFNGSLIVAPSAPPKIISSAPKVNYQPYHVYGYRGYDSRQNLFFNTKGKFVYPLASLGIVMDPKNNKQTFFGGKALRKTNNQHDDNILCLAISHDRKKVATGQAGMKPKLFIWNADTNTYIGKYILSDKKSKAVVACAFSKDGEHIALVDLSADHTVHVVNGRTGKLLWSKPSGKAVVYGIAWSSNTEFVTCGDNSVKFWNIDTQRYKEGTGFDTETMSCVAFDGTGQCHVSSVSGNIYVFNEMKVIKKIRLHEGKINAMLIHDKMLLTAGDDKRVLISKVGSHDAICEIKTKTIPRAADILDDLVVVGDKEGTITLYKGETEVDTWLGHHEEVWGLDSTEDSIITAGDDNKVILWDYNKCRAIKQACINKEPGQKLEDNVPSKGKLPDNQGSRSVCYNPATREVAIATNSGELHIRDIDKIEENKKILQCSKRWIECMRYSPKGDLLAVGTHADEILVYSVVDYTLEAKLRKHLSPLISIDWSTDGTYLRTLDEGLDMFFWKLPGFCEDQEGAKNTKDKEWETQSSKVGWSVQGIYPPGTDKTHVNCVVKSRDNSLIATGDDWGFVNLYNNPCAKGAKCHSLRAHSEHVPRLVFSKDDEYIFSVGGNDRAIIQWKK